MKTQNELIIKLYIMKTYLENNNKEEVAVQVLNKSELKSIVGGNEDDRGGLISK